MNSKEITDEQIIADILHKLHRKKKWGAAHTPFENLYKWCKREYADTYKKVGKELIREGFLLAKPTPTGLHVSLNPRRREEIIRIVHRFFGNF